MVLDFGFIKDEMMAHIDAAFDHSFIFWVDDLLCREMFGLNDNALRSRRRSCHPANGVLPRSRPRRHQNLRPAVHSDGGVSGEVLVRHTRASGHRALERPREPGLHEGMGDAEFAGQPTGRKRLLGLSKTP